MGLYNFKKQFAKFVLSGAKRHTIRAHRRYPDKPGDLMHLYTGLRTKAARLLMRAPCVKVEEIEIVSGCSADDRCNCDIRILVDGVELDANERRALARKDGFKNLGAMQKFWKGRLPFAGQVIHWNPPAVDVHLPPHYDSRNLQVAATRMEAKP